MLGCGCQADIAQCCVTALVDEVVRNEVRQQPGAMLIVEKFAGGLFPLRIQPLLACQLAIECGLQLPEFSCKLIDQSALLDQGDGRFARLRADGEVGIGDGEVGADMRFCGRRRGKDRLVPFQFGVFRKICCGF